MMAPLSQPRSKPPISLPQELVDCIVDHCYYDLKMLRVFALVSKSWLVSARYHLFRTLAVGCNVYIGIRVGKLSTAITLLAAWPSMRLLVRELKIAAVILDARQLVSIIHELRRLKLFHLRDVGFRNAFTASSSPPAEISHGIDILHIHNCYIIDSASPVPVLQLIGLFPSILELNVSRLNVLFSGGVLAPTSGLCRSYKTHLGSLAYYENFVRVHDDGVSNTIMSRLIIDLLGGTTPTSLTLMPFRMNSRANDKGVNTLLIFAASPNLKSLVFILEGTSAYGAPTPVQADMSLSQCASVESVTFRFRHCPQIDSKPWEDAYTILSTFPPSSSVSTVVFLIPHNREKSEQSVAPLFNTSLNTSWQNFEQALSRLPEMRTLRFVFFYPTGPFTSMYPDREQVWPQSMLDFIRSELQGRGLDTRYQLEIVTSPQFPGAACCL